MKPDNTPMDHESRWDIRYREAGERYLFGTEANHYLVRHAPLMQAGQTALAVADGEGRNSVWLAAQRLEVTAVELSAVAVKKTRRLARERQVIVNIEIADMMAADWPPSRLLNTHDWVIGIFIQFVGPAERVKQFADMKLLTRSGGRILLHGYTSKQLDYRTGGPSAVENLYTETMLREAFADWDIEELTEYEEEVAEGTGHKGRSALIGLIARKP